MDPTTSSAVSQPKKKIHVIKDVSSEDNTERVNSSRFSKQPAACPKISPTVTTITKYIQEYDDVQTFTRVVKKKRVETTIHREIRHEDVRYNDKDYTVCYVISGEIQTLFTISAEDKPRIIEGTVSINQGYIRFYHKDSPFQTVHGAVIGHPPSEGMSIDHLNRVRRDNRRENLTFKTQSEQIQNQFVRDRYGSLPDDCGITFEDIPKHVNYLNEPGRGERFEVEIKAFPHLPKNELYWKTTSRRDVPLRVKLQEALYHLQTLVKKYPELESVVRIDYAVEERRRQLTQEYNDIISLTHFPKAIIDANLVDFVYDCKKNYATDEFHTVATVAELKQRGKKSDDNLPEGCGIRKVDIPEYCYYVPETEARGDRFVIDRHPKLIQTESPPLSTPASKLLTTREKFDILLQYLDCLENDRPIEKVVGPRAKRNTFTETKPRTDTRQFPESVIQRITTPQTEFLAKRTPCSNAIASCSTSVSEESIPSEVPRYVYYKAADRAHGSYWYIKDHPGLKERKIAVKTTRTSALLSDREKFDEALDHLNSLDKGLPFNTYETVRAVRNQIHKDKMQKQMPDDWDIETYPIPEWLYYSTSKGSRSDYWIIKGHPKQTKPFIQSSASKALSALEKYEHAMRIVAEFP